MKPVDQTLLYDRDGHGDCLRACVASILELPAASVPDFGLFAWNWMQALVCFCSVQPIVPYEVDAPDVWIALGKSKRGIGHAVVYRGTTMAHDPHPSRAGLQGDIEGGLLIGPLHEHVARMLARGEEDGRG